MVAWIALAVSVVVAGYNVWRDFTSRAFVEWHVKMDPPALGRDVDTDSVPWPWHITNVGNRPAYTPTMRLRRPSTRIWELAASGPPRVEPDGTWTLELRATYAQDFGHSPEVQIEFGIDGARRRRTHQGVVASYDGILPRRTPRSRVRLIVERGAKR